MTSPLLIELHAHGRQAVDITRWTKRVQWVEGVNAPWDSMAVDLALPLGEIAFVGDRLTSDAGSIDVIEGVDTSPGLWLKLTEYATGRPLSMARIDTRPLNLRAGAKGSISNRVSLQALGALSFIRTLAVEIVIGTISEDYGGIMAAGGPGAKRYYELFRRLVNSPRAGDIVGPDGIIAILAPVQIPETLIPGVKTLGELFRIAWGPGAIGAAAPLRTMSRVPLVPGAAIQYLLPQGTALDMILALFQREPRLIEFFPSFEAPTNNQLKTGYADARPTLIHRICPWVTGPISKMVIDTGEASSVQIPSEYDEVTWRCPVQTTDGKRPDPDKGLALRANEGFSLNPTRSEAARVNAVTVNWAVAGGSPSRWLTPAGLPIADRADIDKHGARLMELNWDLCAGNPRGRSFDDVNARLSGRSSGGSSILNRINGAKTGEQNNFETLKTVGYLGWHFYGLGHVFEAGTIEGNYLGVRARAGEPISFDYGGKRPFTAYMTQVTHVAEVREKGLVSARTSIQFDRGLWDERLRDPHVYRETKAATKVTQKPVEQKADEQVANPTGYVLFGGQQLPWRSQTVAMEQRLSTRTPLDRTIRNEASDIDIFVVHFTGGFSTNITRALATFDSASGSGIHFIIDPAGKIYQYMDVRNTAVHADDNAINRRSVGVEVMSPSAFYYKATEAALPPGPWQKLTGFWAGSNVGQKDRWFHGASVAQEAALATLSAFLSANFAVPLTSPAQDTSNPKHLRVPRAGHRADEPVSEGGLGIPIQPGIWHHVEIKNPPEGRIDAMGIILPNVASVAASQVSSMTA